MLHICFLQPKGFFLGLSLCPEVLMELYAYFYVYLFIIFSSRLWAPEEPLFSSVCLVLNTVQARIGPLFNIDWISE